MEDFVDFIGDVAEPGIDTLKDWCEEAVDQVKDHAPQYLRYVLYTLKRMHL